MVQRLPLTLLDHICQYFWMVPCLSIEQLKLVNDANFALVVYWFGGIGGW